MPLPFLSIILSNEALKVKAFIIGGAAVKISALSVARLLLNPIQGTTTYLPKQG
jgi:hypothetical protein